MDIVKEYNHNEHTERATDEDGNIYCPQCEKIHEMPDEEYIQSSIKRFNIENHND